MTENQKREPASAKTCGHEYLRRQVRRPLENPAGKSGVLGGIACRNDGNSIANPVRLGIYEVLATGKISATTSGSVGDCGAKSATQRIISDNLRKSAIPPIAKIRKSFILVPVKQNTGLRYNLAPLSRSFVSQHIQRGAGCFYVPT